MKFNSFYMVCFLIECLADKVKDKLYANKYINQFLIIY